MGKRKAPGLNDLRGTFLADEPLAAGAPASITPETSPQADSEPAPHYHGHRERLRARFLKPAPKGFRIMNFWNCFSSAPFPPRCEAARQDLIARFGSFAEVISPARFLAEVSGLGEAAVTELKIVQAAALKLGQGRVIGRAHISSWRQLVDYCRAAMGFEMREQFRILFLDTKNRLIADEVQQRGPSIFTPPSTRAKLSRALCNSAHRRSFLSTTTRAATSRRAGRTST